MKNPAAVELGKKGGQVKSENKAASSRANGAKGGRPRTYLYAVQVFNRDTDEWANKFPSPMSRDEANKNLKQLRQWAKDDGSGQRYRSVKVELSI